MDCSWSNSSSNILDLRFMPVCVETHNDDVDVDDDVDDGNIKRL